MRFAGRLTFFRHLRDVPFLLLASSGRYVFGLQPAWSLDVGATLVGRFSEAEKIALPSPPLTVRRINANRRRRKDIRGDIDVVVTTTMLRKPFRAAASRGEPACAHGARSNGVILLVRNRHIDSNAILCRSPFNSRHKGIGRKKANSILNRESLAASGETRTRRLRSEGYG